MKKRIELAAVILVSILYLVSFFSNFAFVFSCSTGWPKSNLTGFITSALFLTAYVFLILFYKNKRANYIMLAFSSFPLRLIACQIFSFLLEIFDINAGVWSSYVFLFAVCIEPFYGFTFLLPTVKAEFFPGTGPETINGEFFISIYYMIVLLLLVLKIIMFIRLNRRSKKTHN